jgi:ABC-type branched-subunit amino acid transport system ATPase component/branched-subunit amino acid ABC-type transport system permease component
MFGDFLPFVVAGLVAGSVYGLAGVGLVLTYRTTGVFNFAYGALAAVSVFIFYWLHVQNGLAWPYAAAICVFGVAPVLGVALEFVTRRLEGTRTVLPVLATIGIMLIILGVGTILYGDSNTNFPAFLHTSTFEIGGVRVGWDQLTVFGVSLVAATVLYQFLKRARAGIAMRGVVDNPDLVSMTGQDPLRIRRFASIVGMMFASVAGLLLAPSLSLDASVITLLVVEAFGAAAIGFFSNLPLTFLGGLVLGVASALATHFAATIPALAGLPTGLPFIILFLVLVLTTRRRLPQIAHSISGGSSAPPWHLPRRLRTLSGVVFAALVLLVPTFAGAHLSNWSTAAVFMIVFLSLGLLTRLAGQISLCHLSFAAVGAAAFGHLAADYHWPWFAALLVAGLIAVPVGAIVAIPAIRHSGLYLAIATLGFGLLLAQVFYTSGLMFGPTTAGIPAPRPEVHVGPWNLSSDLGFYYVIVLVLIACLVIAVAIQRGRLGRFLRGMADSSIALESCGASTVVTRILIFCISAGIAGVAGALLASLSRFAIGANYGAFESVTIAALLVIVPGGFPWYALLAGLAYAIVPGYVDADNLSTYLQIAFGISALAFALMRGRVFAPPGILRAAAVRVDAVLSRLYLRLPSGRPRGVAEVPRAGERGRVSGHRPAARPTGLEVRDLSVRYGGVRAVNEFSLAAPIGTVTGLVGPNGAGKTTVFNACSGLVRPSNGEVCLHGRSVIGLGPARRARAGVGRTFQRAELFGSLSVRDNVALGYEAALGGGNPITQLAGRRRDRAPMRRAVDAAIDRTGLHAFADDDAASLPTGVRRMVELARVLAGSFDMLLLDEPSAGLDVNETEALANVISAVAADRECGVLLVEHDMQLVGRVCERVFVLDFGRLIFSGPPAEMLASSIVQNAYLGSPEVEKHA